MRQSVIIGALVVVGVVVLGAAWYTRDGSPYDQHGNDIRPYYCFWNWFNNSFVGTSYHLYCSSRFFNGAH